MPRDEFCQMQFAALRSSDTRTKSWAKKKGGTCAPPCHLEVSLFRFCILRRLADGYGLANVTHLEAGKAADGDVLPQLAHLAGNELADGDPRLLHKRLIEQADFFVKLRHLAFHNLLHHVGRL